MQLSKGTTLQNGKYQIEKVLGQGGFGITYLARQEILEREVCIKEFFMRDFCNRSETNSAVTLGTSANKELIERYLNKFIKEARTIAALDHPNIIHIHDIFKENDTAYYVMDYIEGESLSEMVKRRGDTAGRRSGKIHTFRSGCLKVCSPKKHQSFGRKTGKHHGTSFGQSCIPA